MTTPKYIRPRDLQALRRGSFERLAESIHRAVERAGVFSEEHSDYQIVATHPSHAYVMSSAGEVQRVRYAVRENGEVDITESIQIPVEACGAFEFVEDSRRVVDDATLEASYRLLAHQVGEASEQGALTALMLLREHVSRDARWSQMINRCTPHVLRKDTTGPHNDGQRRDTADVPHALNVLDQVSETLERTRGSQTDAFLDDVADDIATTRFYLEQIEGAGAVEDAALSLIDRTLRQYRLTAQLAEIHAYAANTTQTERDTA